MALQINMALVPEAAYRDNAKSTRILYDGSADLRFQNTNHLLRMANDQSNEKILGSCAFGQNCKLLNFHFGTACSLQARRRRHAHDGTLMC